MSIRYRNQNGFSIGHKKNYNFCSLFVCNQEGIRKPSEYLSGLRYLHIVRGSGIPMLRPPIIEQLIKGKQHINSIERTQMKKPRRAPVTLNIMKLLKKEIISWDTANEDKALVWTTCTVLFFWMLTYP